MKHYVDEEEVGESMIMMIVKRSDADDKAS